METNNKLREALETLVDVVDAWKDHLPSAIREGEVSAALEKANAAIAEPPRNCDIGTTTEQSDRMRHFCLYDQGGCGGCSRRNKGMTFRECVIDWGQMPYEAKKGGNDADE